MRYWARLIDSGVPAMTTVLSFDPSSVLEILIVAPDSCLCMRVKKRKTIEEKAVSRRFQRNKHEGKRKMCVTAKTVIKSDTKGKANRGEEKERERERDKESNGQEVREVNGKVQRD